MSPGAISTRRQATGTLRRIRHTSGERYVRATSTLLSKRSAPWETLRRKLITAPALSLVDSPLAEHVDQSELLQDLHSGVVRARNLRLLPRLEALWPLDARELARRRIPGDEARDKEAGAEVQMGRAPG